MSEGMKKPWITCITCGRKIDAGDLDRVNKELAEEYVKAKNLATMYGAIQI